MNLSSLRAETAMGPPAPHAGTGGEAVPISGRAPAPRLSVIIPVAPGDMAEVPSLLRQLAALPEVAEVLVCRADGATGPDAACIAGMPQPVVDVVSLQGRARQLNAGAGRAGGEWLWFLHADTTLSPAVRPALHAFLERGTDALGYFDLAFRLDGPWLAVLNAWGANLRSRLLGLPFGDQGLLMRKARWQALGGFDEAAAYGEDHLLVWAARAAGLPLQRIPARLLTSARKYRRHGWLHTTLAHWRLTVKQAWPAWRQLRGRRR